MSEPDWNEPPPSLRATRTADGWSITLSRKLDTRHAVLGLGLFTPWFFLGAFWTSLFVEGPLGAWWPTLVLVVAFLVPLLYFLWLEWRRRLTLELGSTGLRWDGEFCDATELERIELELLPSASRVPIAYRLRVGEHEDEVVGAPESMRWLRAALEQVRSEPGDGLPVDPEAIAEEQARLAARTRRSTD